MKALLSGLETFEMDGRTGTDEGRIGAVTATIRRVKPDVVVPVGLAHALVALGRLKLAGWNGRLVFPIHPTDPDTMRLAADFRPIVDLYVCVNPIQARALEAYGGVPTERIRTLPNGTRGAGSDRTGPWVGRGELQLAFVGRLHQPTKSVLDMPSLATELRGRGVEFRFTVVGDGPAAGELSRQLREAGLESRFELLGFLSRSEIFARVYPRQHAVLLFSPLEGCPLVVLEAMAYGVVPILAGFPGARSMGAVRDGETALLFASGNVSEAADHVEALAKDAGQWRRMSDAAVAAIAPYTEDACFAGWESALEDACARRKPVLDPSPDFPLRGRAAAQGRLDRLGFPVGLSEAARRAVGRYPAFPNGWEEWPACFWTADDDERAHFGARLGLLESGGLPPVSPCSGT
jgi:glycosyltransferase involved in cell wall biosynthesis